MNGGKYSVGNDFGDLGIMTFKNETQRIIAYHSWSRGKYLDLYDRLPWEVLTRNREATFGSIRNVHLHILEAYSWWLVKMFGRRSLAPLLKQLDEKNFDRVKNSKQLRALDRKVDHELLNVGRTLTEAHLRQKHELDLGGKKRWIFTEREGIWHVLEEDYLHLGDNLCMLWQDDIEPPYTGYMWWEYDTDPESHPYLHFSANMSKLSEGGYSKSKAPTKRKQSRGR
ncbi:MAG: DinB family protein [Thermoplasmata archaeon]